MRTVRRCLGCSATYPLQEPSCPECGSHAADVEEAREPEDTEAKPKPKPRRRKS
jgi:rRNA maturation endonuclease Nob1